jgi:hypothetical protein
MVSGWLNPVPKPLIFPDGMGNNGSDFTVGEVLLKRGMGNFFKEKMGGIVVFNRVLRPKKMNMLGQ